MKFRIVIILFFSLFLMGGACASTSCPEGAPNCTADRVFNLIDLFSRLGREANEGITAPPEAATDEDATE